MNEIGERKLESLIRTAGRLMAVLEREVESLRAMRVAEIEDLQGEKAALTLAYEECLRGLSNEPAALQAAAPALRDELAALGRRFDGAVAENVRALNAARESQDRLLQAIVEAVSESRARRKSYQADGALDRQRRTPTAAALSLTLDRRL